MASSGNFSTFNPLDNTENNGVGGCDFALGNCQGGGAGDNVGIASTIATGNTGKYYAEFYLSATPGFAYVGYYPSNESAIMTKVWVPSGNKTWLTSNLASYAQTGTLFKDGNTSTSSWGSTFTTGDIIQIAIDADNDAVYYGKNNTWQNSGDPTSGASKTGAARTSIPKNVFPAVGHANGSGTVTWKANFGQDSTFGGTISAGGNADANGFGDFKYAPPSGYTCISSSSIPISDDIDPAQTDDDYPSKQCTAVTFTGNGGTNNITGVGFQADLAIFKNRGTANSWIVVDSSRGGTGSGTKSLNTNGNGAESTGAYTTWNGFASDGFNLSGGGTGTINQSSANMYGQLWRANGGTTASNSDGSITSTVQSSTAGGFSIITYTGTGSNATIGHGLSAKPDFILFKRRSGSGENWQVYHSSLGATKYLLLNHNFAASTSSTRFQDTEPTNSVISIGTESGLNTSSGTHVAYAWHSVEGYSKFGSYTGNSNNDGPFIYTGFRPRILFTKRTENSGGWRVRDTARDTFNTSDTILWWDLSQQEYSNSDYSIDILSNGFKLRTSSNDFNASEKWIYGAWGDVPFKYNNTF